MSTRTGTGTVSSSWIGTGLFLVVTAIAAAVKQARLPAALVDLGLFFGGCGVFLWALASAAGRSREREISVWNLFILEGSAPRSVRRALLGALAASTLFALATAWISAALAFGCLAPMWSLGHCGLWGARHGSFSPRQRASARLERTASR